MISNQLPKFKHSIFRVGLFDIFVLVAIYSLACLQMPKFADDPGVGWHLATGQLILANKSIPFTDPFLSSPMARPWVADQWLSDTIFASLFSIGSWQLVYALILVTFIVTFLIILYRGVCNITGSAFAPCLAVLVAFKISQIHFILRPVVLAFLFFSILYVILARFNQRARDEVPSQNRSFLGQIVTLFVLFAVWANCHPSFVLGLALIAALVVGLIIDRTFFGLSSIRAPIVGKSVVLLVAAFCASLLNPWGLGLHKSILELAQSDFFMNFHVEWRSPDFKNYEGVLFEFSIFVLIVASFVANRTWRWSGFYLVSVLLFAHLGLRSVRVLPFFSIVASIPLAYSLESFGMSRVWEWRASLKRLRRAFAFVECREKGCSRGFFVLTLALALIITFALRGRGIPFYPGAYGPSAQTYSYGALDFLNAAAKESSQLTIVASPDLGGFITFYGNGRLKPVIDDRNTLLGDKFYKSYLDNIRLGGRWQDWLSCVGARYLVLGNETSLAAYLKEVDKPSLDYIDSLVAVFAVKPAPLPNDCATLVHWQSDKL